MTKFPESTYRILACQEFTDGVFDNDLIVDWAIEMLQYGYETDSLLILAGMTKPVNSFEVFPYLSSALKELGLTPLTGESAVIAYAWSCAQQINKGASIGLVLKEVSDLYVQLGMEAKPIEDFYYLYNAWFSYLYGSEDFYISIYWKGATRDNVVQLATDYAKDWCEQHRPQLPTLNN